MFLPKTSSVRSQHTCWFLTEEAMSRTDSSTVRTQRPSETLPSNRRSDAQKHPVRPPHPAPSSMVLSGDQRDAPSHCGRTRHHDRPPARRLHQNAPLAAAENQPNTLRPHTNPLVVGVHQRVFFFYIKSPPLQYRASARNNKGRHGRGRMERWWTPLSTLKLFNLDMLFRNAPRQIEIFRNFHKSFWPA